MKKLNKKGFSLVELIIVIAIMAVLIGVLAPTYLGQVNKSKRSTDLQNAQEIATGIAVVAATAESSSGATDTNVTKTASGDPWVQVTDAIAGFTIPTASALKGSTYTFFYKFDGTNVQVGLGTAAGSVTPLYPVVDSSSDWAK